MRSILTCLLLFPLIAPALNGQNITSSIPDEVSPSAKFLFYLHGGIVQNQGVHAVSEYFGPYEYLKILDVLHSHGFHVISEARPKGTKEVDYAERVSKQIDSLLDRGVTVENITVVGASQGAWITIEIANIRQDKKSKYVILGLCNQYNLNYFSKYRGKLCGNFLSIYEGTDQKLSCDLLLEETNCKTGYSEIRLNMGNGHGFLYKPYDEWVLPMVKWINEG